MSDRGLRPDSPVHDGDIIGGCTAGCAACKAEYIGPGERALIVNYHTTREVTEASRAEALQVAADTVFEYDLQRPLSALTAQVALMARVLLHDENRKDDR